jgi:NADH:ubiquinone oxidoreductase subunit 2 (subunit N)
VGFRLLAAAALWLYALTGVAVIGVVISMYYYFGVIRAMYWPAERAAQPTPEAIEMSRPMRWALGFCIVGMLWLGVLPDKLVTLTNFAANRWSPDAVATLFAATC